MSRVIAIANQKGGVGKTTSTINISAGLVAKGKRVLIVDNDPQGDSTSALGFDPDELEITVSNVYAAVINDFKITQEDIGGILHHKEGMDLMPANIDLCCIENNLVTATCRESILKVFVEEMKGKYDYIIIDCPPSLGMLSINAFTCCDEIIIPVQASALSAKGLQHLIRSIGTVKRKLNPQIKFAGIVITMVRSTNNAKVITEAIKKTYGEHIRVFQNVIPLLVKMEEQAGKGNSIFVCDSKNDGAAAYMSVVEEVLKDECR